MDLLNLSGDQRLDLGDLTFALGRVPTGLVNELTGSFCVAPGENAIITGFRPAASGTTAVVVGEANVPNVAFLGQRIAAAITPGVLTTQGPATQTVSTATLPAATYTVFVRFNRIPGVSQTRKFWAKALPGSEYSQLADTRQVATWEVRLETTSPSAEWVPIATAVVTASGAGQGNTVVVTDTRLLYFEGRVDQGCVPVWGSAADRVADRTLGNTGSLRRQLDAIRSCLVDLKGRGLAKWYQPNISGMLIGSAWTLADLPQPNQLNIGDRRFYFNITTGSPVISFDDANDYLQHNRGAGVLSRFRAGTQVLAFYANGGGNFGQYMAGSGFLSANQPATANQYGFSTYTTDANTPASIGIQSLSAKSAILELGSAGYGNSYAFVRSQWSSGPLMTLGVNNITFLSASASGIDPAIVSCKSSSFSVNTTNGPFSVSAGLGAASFTAGSFSINSKRFIPQSMIFASGFYTPGNNGSVGTVDPFYGSAVNQSISVSINSNNGIVITFTPGIPLGSIASATAGYSNVSGGVYAVSVFTDASSATFYCQGVAAGSSVTSNQRFYFHVFYGG